MEHIQCNYGNILNLESRDFSADNDQNKKASTEQLPHDQFFGSAINYIL